MADVRQRKNLTSEEHEVLKKAWDSGLKSTKQKSEIVHLSAQSGISEDRIKNWIGNYKAKLMPKKKTYIKKKMYKRGPSGYSIFASTVKKGTTENSAYLSHLSQQWNKLTETERHSFNKRAEEFRNDPFLGKSRSDVITEQMKIIKNAVIMLESVGYAIGGVGLDPKEPFNSSKGIRFYTSNAENLIPNSLLQKFEAYFGQGESENPTDATHIRKELREHLRKCWHKSTGLTSSLPYSKISNGTLKITISGMPEGMEFKEPSSYGLKTMQKLLQSQISFEIIRNYESVAESTPQAPSEETIDVFVEAEAKEEHTKVAKEEHTKVAEEEHTKVAEEEHTKVAEEEQTKEDTPKEITNEDIMPLLLIEEDNETDEGNNNVDDSIDIDLLIKQIKSSNTDKETKPTSHKRKRDTSAKVSNDENNKLYTVEKVIKKRGSRVYLKWADGSCSWEPSSSLVISDNAAIVDAESC